MTSTDRVAEYVRQALHLTDRTPSRDVPEWWDAAGLYVDRVLTANLTPSGMRKLDTPAGWNRLRDEVRDELAGALARADAEAAFLAEHVGPIRCTLTGGRYCAVCGIDGAEVPPVEVYRAGGTHRAAERAFTPRWGRVLLCPACRAVPAGDLKELRAAVILDAAGVLESVGVAREDAAEGWRRPVPLPRVPLPPCPAPKRFAFIGLDALAAEVRAALAEPEPDLHDLARRVARLERRVAAR